VTTLQDYKEGRKVGVHVDSSLCSPIQRSDLAAKKADFFYNVEESPFFADKAPHLQDTVKKNTVYLPFAKYTAIDSDAGHGAQKDSDCFSWSTRLMLDINRLNQGLFGEGRKEQYIESSATCLIYGMRGGCGKGMTVYDVIKSFKGGLLLEKEYNTNEGKHYNFERYVDYYRLGVSKWCRSGPPSDLLEQTRKVKIGDYAIASDMDEIDANLANGRTWSCGSGIGVSSKRDEHGVSRLKGGWAHAMAIIGVLLWDWVIEVYGEAVYIWDQSWGNWNTGVYPEWAKKLGIKLPQGYFLLRKSDTWKAVKAKQCVTVSSVEGFPKLKMPNLGAKGRI